MPSDQMNHSCYNWTTGGMERYHERQLPVRVQETASHRPYHMPETPAAFSSQVVRSTTPSTWYAPCSSSTSRAGDYFQSPSDSVDFHWSNQVTIIICKWICYTVIIFGYLNLTSDRKGSEKSRPTPKSRGQTVLIRNFEKISRVAKMLFCLCGVKCFSPLRGSSSKTTQSTLI